MGVPSASEQSCVVRTCETGDAGSCFRIAVLAGLLGTNHMQPLSTVDSSMAVQQLNAVFSGMSGQYPSS